MRRISYIMLLVLCSLLLAGAAGGFTVSATDEAPIESWDITESGEDGSVTAEIYELADDEYSLVISGDTRMKNWSIESPAPWNAYAEYITEVTVKNGVLSLGNNAFFGFLSLKALRFEGVEINDISVDMISTIPKSAVVYAHNEFVIKLYCNEFSIAFFPICAEFQNLTCTECGYKCESHYGGINTCTDGAVCELCKTVYGVAAGHSLSDMVAEIPADCENDGHEAYYTCTVCNGIFDENKNETEKSELVIKAAHDYGELIAARAPTCTSEGIVAHYHCWRCDKYFDENKNKISVITVDFYGHKGGVATCTSPSLCTECGEEYGDKNPENHVGSTIQRYDSANHWKVCGCEAELEKAVHSYTTQTLKEATVEEEGSVKYSCDCGYSYTVATPKLSNDESESGSAGDSSNGSEDSSDGTSGEETGGEDDTPSGGSDDPNKNPVNGRLAVVVALFASLAIIIFASLIAIAVYIIKKRRNKNV